MKVRIVRQYQDCSFGLQEISEDLTTVFVLCLTIDILRAITGKKNNLEKKSSTIKRHQNLT
jgi:hypothetical protein